MGRPFYFVLLLSAFTFELHNKIYGAFLIPRMGLVDKSCDDGKTNLHIDWDNNPNSYTCSILEKWSTVPYIEPFYYVIPNFDPQRDRVIHTCMSNPISYIESPPLRGTHRPQWAKYGEYTYIPSQRWLHNLEVPSCHGAIVMLYHPCADDAQVLTLRNLLTSCMYRHVITPYDRLSPERPLALIAWGAKLEMNIVDKNQTINFIKNHARKGPEDLSLQGRYDEMLIRPAVFVSDANDTIICPYAY